MMAQQSHTTLPKERLRVWSLRGMAILLLLLPAPFGGYPLFLATEGLLLGAAAVALSFLMGHAGIPSLGQAAFLGLGAYTLGLALKAGWPLAGALPLAFGVAALYGLITGFLVFRGQGIFILMLTLAFAQMVYSAAFKWTSLTGGDDGLSLSYINLDPIYLHGASLLYLLLVLAFLGHLLRTPYGKALEAIRQNEEKARALGIPSFFYKVFAYTLTGGLTGIAGAGLALHRTFVSPHDLFWLTSATLVVMVLLGGARGLWGAALGAVFYVLLQAWASSLTNLWGLFVGLLLIVSVLYAREGLWVLLEKRLGGGGGRA